jgi:hypothetical protein
MTMILALDQSLKRSGWALLDGGKVVASGWFGSKGSDPVAEFRWHVRQLILDFDPEALAWEKPAIFRSQRASLSGARLDQALRDLADEHGLKGLTVGASTWRSQVLGKGAGRLASEAAKCRALFYCHLTGIEVRDHNQAEAICIGIWAATQLRTEALA